MIRIVPKDINIDFIGKMRPAFYVSGGLVILSLFFLYFGDMVGRGPVLGIDFAGGTEIEVHLDESLGIADLRGGLTTLGLGDDSVQTFGAPADNNYLVRIQSISFGAEAKVAAIMEALKRIYGEDAWEEPRYDPEQAVSFLAVQKGDEAIDPEALQIALEGDAELESVLGRWYVAKPAGTAPAPAAVAPGDDDSAAADDDAPVEAPAPSATVEEKERWVSTSLSQYGAFVVQLPGITEQISTQLAEVFGKDSFEVRRVESVGPKVGRDLRRNGARAVLVSLLFILIYIAFRFDLAFSPGAIVALTHDVFVTLLVFILLGLEFNITIIAALLTIVGYSLNDTIVVYDRIRENMMRFKRQKLDDVINKSINETLSRTLMTSLTTAMVVICLLVFGGPIIKPFSVALLTGVLVGTYSSVFIASPLIIFSQRWLPVQTDEAK